MGQHTKFWYLLHFQAAKARICPLPTIIFTVCHWCRGRLGPKLRPIALLDKSAWVLKTGLSQALEILENLENHEKKFHALKKHGI